MNQFIPTSFNPVLESRGHSPQHLLTPVIQELKIFNTFQFNIIIILKRDKIREVWLPEQKLKYL